jgi:hypothetical protein
MGAGAALAAGITVAAGAGAAQAGPPTLPYYCEAGPIGTSAAYASCWGGSGSFRAAVTCAVPDAGSYVVQGPWRGTAPSPAQRLRSVATCDDGDQRIGSTVERSTGLVGEPL